MLTIIIILSIMNSISMMKTIVQRRSTIIYNQIDILFNIICRIMSCINIYCLWLDIDIDQFILDYDLIYDYILP